MRARAQSDCKAAWAGAQQLRLGRLDQQRLVQPGDRVIAAPAGDVIRGTDWLGNGGFVRNLIEKARDHRNSRLDTDELDAMLAAHHVDASDEDLVRRFRVLLAEDFAEGLPVAAAEAERSRDEPPGQNVLSVTD